MKKLKELFKSPHIHIALATGVCIILLAYISKRVLPQPMNNLLIAVPPFFASIYEVLLNKHENKGLLTTWYWIVVIFFATTLVVVIHLV